MHHSLCCIHVYYGHVIGFIGCLDLWVIRIKKPIILCTPIVHGDQVNRARNADYTERTCERSVYSIVKIARLYDYQTWQTHFWKNSRGVQRFVGLFLGCAFWMLIGWSDKLQSRGYKEMPLFGSSTQSYFYSILVNNMSLHTNLYCTNSSAYNQLLAALTEYMMIAFYRICFSRQKALG